MRQTPSDSWFTVKLSWQRLLAGICFTLALCVLVYGFLLRPAVSTYVGRQVGERIGQEVADQLADAVITGGLGGAGSASGAGQGGGQGAQTGAGGQAAALPGQPVVTPVPGGVGEAQPVATTIAGAVVEQLQGSSQPGGAAAGSDQGAAGGTGPEGAGGAGGGQAAGAGQGTGAGAGSGQGGAAGGSSGGVVIGPTSAVQAPVVGTPIAGPQSERSLQEIVEALPVGEITVTEQKLNDKIAPRVANMAPIERVQVQFVPGLVRVTLAVFGGENLATAGLGVSGNRVVVREPKLDGPLGVLVSAVDLVRPIEEELNNTLELADRQVRSVRIEQGQIVVTLN